MYALKLLRNSDLSEATLREKMRAKNCPEVEVDAALEWILRHHLVDEMRQAERWLSGKGAEYGPIGIAHHLESLKLAPEVLQASLDSSQVDFGARATIVLAQKFDKTDAPAKMARYLASRGFEEETVLEVVAQYSEQEL